MPNSHAEGACRHAGDSPYFRVRPLIPGGRCSQGGVKIPTGGKGEAAQARERLLPGISLGRRVSRFGVIPKPTVKVRMKENGRDSRISRGSVVPYALILVLKEESHESDCCKLNPNIRILPKIEFRRSKIAPKPAHPPAPAHPRFAKAAAGRLRAVVLAPRGGGGMPASPSSARSRRATSPMSICSRCRARSKSRCMRRSSPRRGAIPRSSRRGWWSMAASTAMNSSPTP